MYFLFYFIENQLQGKVGEPAYLEDWITTITSLTAGKSAFKVTFDRDNEKGVPGAILIKNKHHSEFYLKSITLEDVLGQGQIHYGFYTTKCSPYLFCFVSIGASVSLLL